MKGKKIVKGIAATCLTCMVLLGSTAAVSGDAPVSNANITVAKITPYMLYTNSTTTGFNISASGSVTGYASVVGYKGITTKIVIYLYLEKFTGGTWTIDNSWSSSTFSYRTTLNISDTVTHGYTYRLRGFYYVYSGTAYERTDVASASQYY
jgi:hypothetical protein